MHYELLICQLRRQVNGVQASKLAGTAATIVSSRYAKEGYTLGGIWTDGRAMRQEMSTD